MSEQQTQQPSNPIIGFDLAQPVTPVTPVPIEPRKKTCSFYAHVSRHVQELAKAAPGNKIVGGILLRMTGKMPPEFKSFEELVEWVEYEYNPVIQRPPTHGPARNEVAFTVDVSYSATETGTARYSAGVSDSAEIQISESLIRDLINETDSISDTVERLERMIYDNELYAPSYEAEDADYSYSRHEFDSTDDESCDFSSRQMRENLVEWLRENLPEERFDEVNDL